MEWLIRYIAQVAITAMMRRIAPSSQSLAPHMGSDHN